MVRTNYLCRSLYLHVTASTEHVVHVNFYSEYIYIIYSSKDNDIKHIKNMVYITHITCLLVLQ